MSLFAIPSDKLARMQKALDTMRRAACDPHHIHGCGGYTVGVQYHSDYGCFYLCVPEIGKVTEYLKEESAFAALVGAWKQEDEQKQLARLNSGETSPK